MTFVTLSKIDNSTTLLDIAFRAARERRDFAHKDIKGRSDVSRIEKSQRAEKYRIMGAGRSLVRQLRHIHDAFPSFNNLAPFYQELIRTVVDMDEVRHALGGLHWAAGRIEQLTHDYTRRVEACEDLTAINKIRREHYGRVASTLKQVDKNLAELERVRKAFKDLPSLKTEMFTVVVAGMPNVGKSTLMTALTGAKPEIKPYPFTTQHLMLGYMMIGDTKVQIVDTPGLLDRPIKKRNSIEARAALAMTHLATCILFVIDPTLQSGYPLDAQLSLLEDTKEQFKVPFIIVVNKADAATIEEKAAVPKGLKATPISAKTKEGVDNVKTSIKKLF